MLLELLVTYQLEVVRESLTGTHCRYREYVAGVPSEHYETRPCGAAGFSPLEHVPDGGLKPASPLVIAQGRILRREISRETLTPVAEDYDAATGELVRRVPLYFHGKPARVFDPNPVAALNDPTLQDRNDAASAVPEGAYREVELERTNESGPLQGAHVRLVDTQIPGNTPPDAGAPLLFDRGEDGFEDVQAYFHIDRNQEYMQSLGFHGGRAIVPYAIEVDAHAGAGLDNSVFLPSFSAIGRGTLYFGEGGTDDAEDADLVVHEYGHAILEWVSPGTFSGTFAAESRALGEAFGDYWAFSAHRAQRVASGRDPYCFADWDARCWENSLADGCAYAPGSDCLRRLDSAKTMADYERIESAGVEHRNGLIFSSALRELHERLGRETIDTIVLESLFGAPPHPTFALMAQRMIETDRLLNNGTNASAICSVMASRGILTTCEVMPRGAQTLFQSSERMLPIADANTVGVTSTLIIHDPRVIDELFVRVDIDHPTRGDLQIVLIGPDGTTVMLQQISIERGPDIHATYGLTAVPLESLDVFSGRMAAGTWTLKVRDLRFRDAGTLLSWGLVIRVVGDAPAIERPRHARSQIVPVVAHLYGSGARQYVSDVRIANVTGAPQRVTLTFTRSGENGNERFSTFDMILEAGHTGAIDDIVARAFHTTGSGSLEVLGDVVVMSRLYEENATGTLGQQVPPDSDATSRGEAVLLVAPHGFPGTPDRINLGITETSGNSGVVRLFSQSGRRDIPILPFSHVQFPYPAEPVAVSVLEGDARVVAYLSQLDAVTKDPMFIPAQTRAHGGHTLMVPSIDKGDYRTEIWFTDLEADITHFGLEGFGTQSIHLLPGAFAGARIRRNGTSQYVPPLPAAGPAVQHLLFIENPPPFRLNIGIASDQHAFAEVTYYDVAGNVLSTGYFNAPSGLYVSGLRQSDMGGRVRVRFIQSTGRAFASLIDPRTGDATYVHGQ